MRHRRIRPPDSPVQFVAVFTAQKDGGDGRPQWLSRDLRGVTATAAGSTPATARLPRRHRVELRARTWRLIATPALVLLRQGFFTRAAHQFRTAWTLAKNV